MSPLGLSSSVVNTAAAEAFASATLEIIEPQQKEKQHLPWGVAHKTKHAHPAPPASVHHTRAYYRDSSGRARVHLRVRLEVTSASYYDGGLEALLKCGCIQPVPVELNATISSTDAIAAAVVGKTSVGLSVGEEERSEIEDKVAENEECNGDSNEGVGEEEQDNLWQNELSTIGTEMKGRVKSPWCTDTTFTFECSVASPSNTSSNSVTPQSWALEGVTILRSKIERRSSSSRTAKSKAAQQQPPISALLFDIEIAVGGNGVIKNTNEDSTTNNILEEGDLELCAVLRQKTTFRGNDTDENDNNNTAAASLLGCHMNKEVGIAAGLLGLEFGGGSLSPSVISRGVRLPPGDLTPRNEMEMHYGTNILRTSPLHVHATLVPPVQLTVREVCGARAASGSTLVEITVEHSSEWHRENVTVTGIAFHPGQSRLWHESSVQQGGGGDVRGPGDNHNEDEVSPSTMALSNNNHPADISEGKSMQGGELSVIDMSRRVRWGFAPGSAPDLPLVLGPHEAFATVIQVDAGEDVRSRAFLSPISVNAMIGGCSDSIDSQSGSHDNNDDYSTEKEDRELIMITADARWTSSRVGVENSDAFRVDMSLRGGLETTDCRVGAPLVVSLRVLNLSMEPRDLMLLMAKDGEGRNGSGLQWERPGGKGRTRRTGQGGNRREQLLHHCAENAAHSKDNHRFNTAVVSEVNGYTFGVWGLSGDDDGTTRHHRDHELLAVDAALLLGEVKGQHSIEAELRYVPLREGTLDVPNLKLYDKRGMKWYNCVHTLKIVARQSNV